MTNTTVIRAVNPILPAADVEKSITFYEEKLGFTTSFRYGEPTFYAGLKRGPVELHVCRVDDISIAEQMKIRIQVENIEPLYREYEGKGVVAPTARLETKPWGTREFGLFDAHGVAIIIYEDAPAPP